MLNQTNNQRLFPLRAGIAFCMVLALAQPAHCTPVILTVTLNPSAQTLTIVGKGLQPISGIPVVTAAGVKLALVSNNGTQITAKLPTPPPESLLLTVTVDGVTTPFEITDGSVGPAGPQGAAGAAGPAGPAGPQGPPGSALTFPYYGSVGATDTAFNIYNSAGGAILGWGDATGYGVSGIGGNGGSSGNGGIGLIGTGGSATVSGAGVVGTGGTGFNGGDGVDATGGVGTGVENSGNGVHAVGGDGQEGDSGYGVYAFGGNGANPGAGVFATGGNSNGEAVAGGATGVVGFGGTGPGKPSGAGGLFYGGGNLDDGLTGGDGIDAYPGSQYGVGVYASCSALVNPPCPGLLAALFDADVQINGNLSKAGGSFQIDHPLDPANKYLYHSFVGCAT